jgi:hypothetical protein
MGAQKAEQTVKGMSRRRASSVVALWVVSMALSSCSCSWRARSFKGSLLALQTVVLIDALPRPSCALPRPRNGYGIQAVVKQRVGLWLRAVSVSDLMRGKELSAVRLEVLDSRGSSTTKALVEPKELSTSKTGFGDVTFTAMASDIYVIRASFPDGTTRSSTYSPWIIVHSP